MTDPRVEAAARAICAETAGGRAEQFERREMKALLSRDELHVRAMHQTARAEQAERERDEADNALRSALSAARAAERERCARAGMDACRKLGEPAIGAAVERAIRDLARGRER